MLAQTAIRDLQAAVLTSSSVISGLEAGRFCNQAKKVAAPSRTKVINPTS